MAVRLLILALILSGCGTAPSGAAISISGNRVYVSGMSSSCRALYEAGSYCLNHMGTGFDVISSYGGGASVECTGVPDPESLRAYLNDQACL